MVIALPRRRIARSLVTILVLTFIQFSLAPFTSPPSASAASATTGICTVDTVTAVTSSNITDLTGSDGTCVVKILTGSASFQIPAEVNSISALIVGGGGGGGFGSNAGGGGAGSVITTTTGITVPSGSLLSATVGGGGAAGINASDPTNQTYWNRGNTGTASSLSYDTSSFSASGGGYGGGNGTTSGGNGGSGGGSAAGGAAAGAATQTDYAGWTEYANAGFRKATTPGGGGGGAGAAATYSSGGIGVTIFGLNVGGGGNGWQNETAGNATTYGGGVSRGSGSFPCNSCNGVANTGGGGGGGGAGGSGIVVVKFIPARGQGTIAQSNVFQLNRSSTFTFTRTGTVPASTSVTYQWQVKSAGSSTWSDVTTGTGGTTTTYQTPILSSSESGSTYRIAVTDTQATYGISTTTYTETPVQTLFTPPGTDTDTALYFNGNTYVKVADSNEVDFTNAFTFQAWVKPEAMTSYGMILNKEDSVEFYISGGYYGIAAQKALNQWGYFQTGVPAVVGEWHHIAYTRAANSTTVSVYLDGYLAWSGVIDVDFTGAPLNTSYPLMIGGRSGTGNGTLFDPSFKGLIDHVAVYSAVRSEAQIQSDMNNYVATDSAELRLYYDFNEGYGSTLYNRKTGSTSASDMTLSPTPPVWTDVKEVSTSAASPYTIVKFPRSYITINGGWKVPANVSKASALVIAGGGGGGSRAAGGGGAGGLVYRSLLTLNPGAVETVTIGQGGLGGLSVTALTLHPGLNGQNSQFGSHALAIGGGGGGGAGGSDNSERNGRDGGSGGGASGASAGGGSSAAYGIATQITTTTYGLGNRGGSGVGGSYWNGGGGGGSGGAGSHSSTSSWVAGNGGAGTIDPVGMSNLCLAAGGGGGTISGGSAAGSAGSCASGTITAGAGSIGSVIAGSALANSGSGGGGSGYSASADVGGGNGGSGVIIIRWITALVPVYTKPTNAYLNVGMTETFTTNVAQDSATAVLTRTFKWESTTPSANGTYTLIKQGTGASNASFSWIPTDTSTSGSGYLYRLTVTDSDTAGLFITDSSTAFAVINRALVVSGTSTVAKTINVSKNETFTITLGTATYRPTLSPAIPGITLDTSTAGIAVVKISETMTVGTYYETLTVTDSVSASIMTPLTIIVAAPPTFTATAEQVDSGTVLHLDSGNSASLIPGTNQSWKDLSGRGLQASFPPSVMPAQNQGPSSCTSPTYSTQNLGILNFDSSDCGYIPSIGAGNLTFPYTYQAWVKRNGSMQVGSVDGDYSSIIATPWVIGKQIGLTLHWRHTLNSGDYYLEAGVWGNPTWYSAKWPTPIPVETWVFVTVTFNGTSISISIDNQSAVSTVVSTNIDAGNIESGLLIGKRFDQDGYFFNGSIASLRLYNRILTSAEISQNYNATKNRFLTANIDLGTPSQKYGITTTETYTVTSGYGSDSFTYAVGNKAGVRLETTTSTVILKMQESLTATTHYETITVTDSLGASTYLPIKMTVSKADTLTISMDTATVITYNGSPITSYPKPVFKGLAGVDTLTVTTKFSSSLYPKSATVPTNSDTYTVIAEDPIFGLGALSNYVNVVYETSTAVVNKAKQPALSVFLYGGTVGSAFPITVTGGAGDGAISETVTAGGTMTGCSISNHVLTATSSSQGFCRVYIVKALSQNYLSESITVDMYFMAYLNYQPSGQVGSGATIAINGSTSLTIDDTSTVRAPNVTSLSVSSGSVGTTIHIYGGNFGAGPLTIKFYRNKIATGTVASGSDITVTVPSGATTGPILVITANGEATTPTFTVLP